VSSRRLLQVLQSPNLKVGGIEVHAVRDGSRFIESTVRRQAVLRPELATRGEPVKPLAPCEVLGVAVAGGGRLPCPRY